MLYLNGSSLNVSFILKQSNSQIPFLPAKMFKNFFKSFLFFYLFSILLIKSSYCQYNNKFYDSKSDYNSQQASLPTGYSDLYRNDNYNLIDQYNSEPTSEQPLFPFVREQPTGLETVDTNSNLQFCYDKYGRAQVI